MIDAFAGVELLRLRRLISIKILGFLDARLFLFWERRSEEVETGGVCIFDDGGVDAVVGDIEEAVVGCCVVDLGGNGLAGGEGGGEDVGDVDDGDLGGESVAGGSVEDGAGDGAVAGGEVEEGVFLVLGGLRGGSEGGGFGGHGVL